MKKLILAIACFALVGCEVQRQQTTASKEKQAVERQQSQYLIAQPVPAYDYSLERDLLIQLYNTRNREVTTHSVWRSDYGLVEGDCASMGYGLPYDTSLTNPVTPAWKRGTTSASLAGVGIGQPEPNGVFASTNTSATWVFCLGKTGRLEPVYVESKVTVYPGPVSVDYATNRVLPKGEANVSLAVNE